MFFCWRMIWLFLSFNIFPLFYLSHELYFICFYMYCGMGTLHSLLGSTFPTSCPEINCYYYYYYFYYCYYYNYYYYYYYYYCYYCYYYYYYYHYYYCYYYCYYYHFYYYYCYYYYYYIHLTILISSHPDNNKGV